MHKSVKWIRNILLLIFVLAILFILILHTPFAKNLIRGKLEAYMTTKTGGQFRIASINYRLPQWIEMDGVSIRNKSGDTVLTGEKMRIDLNLFKVLRGKYEINKIDLDGVNLNLVKKAGDSIFNYQFLVDAFTTKTDSTKKRDTSALVLSLHEIHIKNSNFRWLDPSTGTALNSRIGRLDLMIDTLDIDKNRYTLSQANIVNVYFDMHYTKYEANGKRATPYALPFIRLNNSRIIKTHIIHKDDVNGISTDDMITDMQLMNAQLHPSGSVVVEKALVANSSLALSRYPLQNAVIRKDTVTGRLIRDSLGVVHVKELRSWHNNIVYDVMTIKPINGFDLNHISLTDFSANARNIDYTGKKTNVQVLSASGTDKSGLIIDSLRGNFAMVLDSSIYITDGLLQTLRSRIKGSAYLYPYSFIAGNRSKVNNVIKFRDNVISKADLMILAPAIARQYSKALQGISKMYVTAEADGNANRWVVHRVTFRSDKNDVYLDATGDITNAMSKNAMHFNARIYQLNMTRSVMQGFMDAKMLKQISLPPSMNVKGTLSGGMNELVSNLNVNSSYGAAVVQGRLSNITTPTRLSYNLKIFARNLETGKWIKQDSLFGRMTGTISAKGSGIDYKTASIQSVMDISSIRVKNRTYNGIHVDLSGTKGAYDFNAVSKDPLMLMSMRGNTNLNQKYPTVKGNVNIQYLDLYALGLSKDSLAIKTKGYVDIKNLDPDALNALLRLDSTVVYYKGRSFGTDSLLARGYIDSGNTIITLNSGPADATLKGIYRYTELGAIFQQYLDKYMSSGKPVINAPVARYDITMDVEFKPDPLYAVLIPGLFFDKNMSLRGRISDNMSDSTRYLDLAVPTLVYQGNSVSALTAHANEAGDSLRFTAKADSVQVGAVKLNATSINGGLSNNRLTANFSTNDPANRERYAFSVTGNKLNDLFQFRLNDQVKLNYQNWQVNGNNNIVVGAAGFNIDQLSISKGRESISANSINRELNAPLDLKVDNFALHNVMSLYNPDSLQLDGNLNASVRVSDFTKTIPTLDGSINIDSLQYQSYWLGNLAVNARTINNAAVELSGSLKGNGNNIDVKGTYDHATINAQLNLNPIQFKTLEPFTQGQLMRSSGSLTGPINITGSVKSPEWSGTIRFDSVYTQLKQLGTGLRIDNQQLELKYPMINFKDFTVRDSVGHPLTANGSLILNNKNSFNADLKVSTRDFYILNSTAVNNNQLYGKAIIDADMTIIGPIMTPDITGHIAVKDSSNITFVKQQIIASAKERESVMQFVDMDTVKSEFIIAPAADWRNADNYTAINYNLDIDISKDAQFNIIVDPLTRDILQVKGAGQLNAGVSPNGIISVTGAYNLSQGSYVMNYQFIRRKFELQEGSTLVFTGDPMNAEADITAIYAIEAAPYDLIGNEVSDNNALDLRLYKQKVPFEVLLKIRGRISAPQLSFDVRMKEGVAGISYNFSNTIDNKLAQLRGDVAGMNKQVFGLLVMGRFIGEQSTDFFGALAGGGNGLQADDLVRESVSRFLSDAVNQLASNLIKGVDVDVNFATAENYGDASQRTDLNLALSKRFMNDRLTVTVGKSFTVEGNDPVAKNGGQSLPDITTTYKLSKDGRFMLKAYQRNQYEAVLDGYFVETGIAFTLSMDYNRFVELLHKNKMK
jgi:hypothetical protein